MNELSLDRLKVQLPAGRWFRTIQRTLFDARNTTFTPLD
jgi:hypothetical protein